MVSLDKATVCDNDEKCQDDEECSEATDISIPSQELLVVDLVVDLGFHHGARKLSTSSKSAQAREASQSNYVILSTCSS